MQTENKRADRRGDAFHDKEFHVTVILSCGKYVGHAFHLLRVKKKMTQVQLCDTLTDLLGEKVTQGCISKIENGEKDVSWDRFGAFCVALGQTPETVMTWALQCAHDDRKSDVDALSEVARMTAGSNRRELAGSTK